VKMAFIKVIKNKAYYKRYQVKYRRRRECKTDYYARKRLIIQDKNKYKTPKYRFTVRITNKDIICQVFMADLVSDVCIASAYAHELRRYGVKVGLTNYAAAYCTGLLLARRVNAKFGLEFKGNTDAENIGEDYDVMEDEDVLTKLEEEEGAASPFCALLDVGLARTSTGARIFGALKGMCDGGVDVPHNNRRYPGTTKDSDKTINADAEKHREYIFGQHVANYMKKCQEDDDGSYEKQFSQYIAAGVGADDLEDMYEAAHKAIRANPSIARGATELGSFGTRSGAKPTIVKKRFSRKRSSLAQRKDRIRQKLTHRKIESMKDAL